MHISPANQGQMIERAYLAHDGMVYRRVRDKSDGTTEYAVSKMLVDDDGCYWNHPPRNRRWRTITTAEFDAALSESE
jgi:hypothetical protein